MNLPLYIARRQRFKPDDRRSLSPGIVIATAGIAISLIVMLFSIAIVTGFKHQIRDKIMGFDSQITLSPEGYLGAADSVSEPAATAITLSPELIDLLSSTLPERATFRPSVKLPAIVKTDSDFRGLIMASLPPAAAGQAATPQSFVAQNIIEGEYPVATADSPAEARNRVVLSRITASALGIGVGDRIDVHFFIDDKIKSRRLTVAAIYDSHFNDYDSRLAFAPLPTLQSVAHLSPDQASCIEIEGLDEEAIDATCGRLHDRLMQSAYQRALPLIHVSSVHATGAIYFGWLQLLDTNVTVILILMALVAGFTLVSSTFIIILERVNMIGILKTLGMPNGAIRRIFFYLAQKIVILGLVIGNVVGIALLLLQQHFEIVKLDPEAYYLTTVPVELNLIAILALNVGVVAVASLMLLMPTAVISRISPARTVKYE